MQKVVSEPMQELKNCFHTQTEATRPIAIVNFMIFHPLAIALHAV